MPQPNRAGQGKRLLPESASHLPMVGCFPTKDYKGLFVTWRAHYILGSGSFSIFLFMVEAALCRSQQHYVTVLQLAPSSFMLLDGPPAAAEEVVMLSCICCQKQKLDDFTWHAVQQSGACMISHRQLVLPNR